MFVQFTGSEEGDARQYEKGPLRLATSHDEPRCAGYDRAVIDENAVHVTEPTNRVAHFFHSSSMNESQVRRLGFSAVTRTKKQPPRELVAGRLRTDSWG